MEAGGGREIRRALRQAPDYRIDAKRLSAKGVGSYAPLASNDAEPGREKNRRVELVKQ
jgi:OOP family OmpA-OmpF porin